MSESTEMYLLKIALMQGESDPVPIPQLAETLGISHVSTNQMCRKLDELGLLEYLPYRGVTLTPSGQAEANLVIRRRRLWEVFLVEQLGLSLAQAEEAACAFEHVTPDAVADRLCAFLGDPAECPHGKPIPQSGSQREGPAVSSLSTLGAGESAQVSAVSVDEVERDYLRAQGVIPGADIEVLAVGEDGGVLVETGTSTLSLSGAVACHIEVALVSSHASTASAEQRSAGS